MTIENLKTSGFSSRRLLSPDEIEHINSLIPSIWIFYLDDKEKELFKGINKHFRESYRLSDKQISCLKRFKDKSDTEYHRRKEKARKYKR